jgi:Mg2+-importing ATPase
VDAEQITKPRPWDMGEISRFILFVGPCSSVFDYTTYFMMLYLFGCWDVSTPERAAHSASLFQTGWFVESLLTQTLIIHIIRTNRIPFFQSRASWPLMVMTAVIMALGVWLPSSPVGPWLGFTSLPGPYWPLLVLTLFCYVCLTQGVKTWLIRKGWI